MVMMLKVFDCNGLRVFFVELFLQFAPAIFNLDQLRRQLGNLVVKLHSFLGIGGRLELFVGLLLLLIELGNGPFEVGHFLADFPFGSLGALGRALASL